MKPPGFWQAGHAAPWLLQPFALAYAAMTARRVARPGWTAPVPVICCGNPGAGGAGKTPLALDLAARLQARGAVPAFLTRGHGGGVRGPVRVEPGRHDAADVGDEALLLASRATTYVGADRAATARMAIAEGATVLVMDDGLQNPSLCKTLSLLVVDGGAGFGNGHVIPAGPLREPVARAANRCRAAVLIGPDRVGAVAALPVGFPTLAASLVPDASDLAALPPHLLAFAGIGRPAKFFETLHACGHAPVETIAFADHHPYSDRDLRHLLNRAAALDAVPVTTQKDFVRLPVAARSSFRQLRVGLVWADPRMIDTLLTEALADS